MRAFLMAFALFQAVLTPAVVEFKVRGYFIAPLQSRAIGAGSQAPRGKLSLIAYPERTAKFGRYKGFRVALVNATRAGHHFEAQDLRINVVREALDPAGRWRPVEYLPDSWCGNSYHVMYLPPGRYWSFTAPVYAGAFLTRMRFVLEQPGLRLVSNEFAGSVNLEQFEVLQGHTPTNIMDPYRE